MSNRQSTPQDAVGIKMEQKFPRKEAGPVMHLKNFAVALFLLPIIALSQSLDKAALARGATVEIVRIDSATNAAVLRITNTSKKDITAYVLSATAIYADGKTQRDERMADFLPAMIAKQVYAGSTTPGEDLFHPGESREDTASFNTVAGNPILHVDAKLEVVAYADQTIEVLNEDAFGRLMDVRNGSLAAKQKALEVMRNVLSNPVNPNPITDALNQVEELRSRAKMHNNGELAIEYLWVKRDLQKLAERSSRHNSLGTQSLRDYVATTEHESALLALHTRLRRLP
jgi:hypothetical protein